MPGGGETPGADIPGGAIKGQYLGSKPIHVRSSTSRTTHAWRRILTGKIAEAWRSAIWSATLNALLAMLLRDDNVRYGSWPAGW